MMNNYFSKAIQYLGLSLFAIGCSPSSPSSARQLVNSLEQEAQKWCDDANYHPDEYLATRKVAWTAARRDALLQLAGYASKCVTWKCEGGNTKELEVGEDSESGFCIQSGDFEARLQLDPILRERRQAILAGKGKWAYDTWNAHR